MPVANAPAVLDTPGTAVLAPKPPAPIKPLPPLKKAPPQLAATTPLIPPELSPGHPNLEKRKLFPNPPLVGQSEYVPT